MYIILYIQKNTDPLTITIPASLHILTPGTRMHEFDFALYYLLDISRYSIIFIP